MFFVVGISIFSSATFDREQSPFAQIVFQHFCAAFSELNAGTGDQVFDGAGNQHVANVGLRGDFFGDFNGQTAYLIVEHVAFAGVQPGDTVAVDGQVLNLATARQLQAALSAAGMGLRTDIDLLDRAWGLEPSSRLSCQAILSNQDVTIEIPKYSINHAKENH